MKIYYTADYDGDRFGIPDDLWDVLLPKVIAVDDFPVLDCGSSLGRVEFLLDSWPTGGRGLKQIHSDILVEGSAAALSDRPVSPQGDGLWFTWNEGCSVPSPLVIQTADCLAVVIAATWRGRRFVCAFHAGWRGYCAGIHLRAIERLQAELGEDVDWSTVTVAVGPAIFGHSYPCGDDVAHSLTQHASAFYCSKSGRSRWRKFWESGFSVSPKNAEEGKIYPDLQLLLCCDMLALGVSADGVQVVRDNTFTAPRWISYRRGCVAGYDEERRILTVVHLSGTPAQLVAKL